MRINALIGTLYTIGITFALNLHWGHDGIYGQRSYQELTTLVIMKELFELILLIGQYYNVRPRVWPQFFSLDMHEDQQEFFEELDPVRRQF